MQRIKEWCEILVASASEKKASFIRGLSETNHFWDTLEWGESAFRAAAEEKVARYILQAMKRGSLSMRYPDVTVANLVNHAVTEALEIAQMGVKSTSDCANLVRRYEGCAWAKMAEFLQSVQKAE